MSNLERISLLKTFCSDEPDNPFNFYALALEFREMDKVAARQFFDRVITDFPTYLPAYFPAAHFFFELNELEKAKQLFETGIALAINLQDEKAKKELTNAYQNFLFETDMD
jgi:Tfp pilus assembly protein PilF